MPASESLDEYFESNPVCSYHRHIDEIPTGQREETMSDQATGIEVDEDGYWQCPHPRLEDHDRCLFHTDVADKPPEADISDRISALLSKRHEDADRSDRKRAKQFIGATFEEIDLHFERVDTPDNIVIDLRCCDGDTVNLEATEITNPVDIRNGHIDRLEATKSTWNQLYAQELTADLIEFDQASLERAYFEDSKIDEAQFYWTEIDYVNYHRCDIRWANFMYAQLGEAGFFDAEFFVATFCNADIGGGYFNDASFSYVNYSGVDGRSAHFSGVTADVASFRSADLGKLSIKRNAAFDWIIFDTAEIGTLQVVDSDTGITSIENAQIDNLLLERFSFYHIIALDRTTVRERAVVSPAESDGEFGYISYRDAEIAAGEFENPRNRTVVHDFTGAVVGDIDIHSRSDESPLADVRFYRTDFDGFKFSKLAEVNFDDLRYTIHTVEGTTRREIQVARALPEAALELHPTFGDADPLGASGKWNEVNFQFIEERGIEQETRARALEIAREGVDSDGAHGLATDLEGLEATYLQAKNGASTVGDSVTAGRFFERERRYRRKRHWQNMLEADSLSNTFYRGSQWIRNWLFAATAGYGERPLRVVGSSAGVVVLFTVAYLLSNEPLAGIEEPTSVEYFLFSFQSFIAFVVGPPSATNAVTIRLLSAFEGFVGAFIVGLFVFVLTRQVHR